MTRDEMMELLKENEVLLADGLEDALVGICEVSGRAVYHVGKVLKIYTSGGMSHDEALEFFDFNVMRSLPYLDPDMAPIFVNFAESSAPVRRILDEGSTSTHRRKGSGSGSGSGRERSKSSSPGRSKSGAPLGHDGRG